MSFTAKNKLIHIATDEKFINNAYWQFEQALPSQNLFYILVNTTNSEQLKYLKLEEHMVLIKNNLNNVRIFLKKIEKYEHFIFHGLGYTQSVIFNRLPRGSFRCWILFGAEFYQNSYLFNSRKLLGHRTNLLFRKETSRISVFKNLFRNSYYKIKNKTKNPGLEIKDAIESADFLGLLYKDEFNFIKSKVNNKTLQYFKFSYYPIEKMLNDTEKFVSGDNILLGNSASYTNNHLDVIDLLSKLNITNKKIICPLSYGNELYAEKIRLEGQLKLKDSFKALVDFMPLQEYNLYLEKCGFVIMNHYRQQAVGNVMVMLWMGAKVFLDERNTLYHYLKRLNIYVFSVKLDLNENELSSILTRDQQLHNRKILLQEIGQDFLLHELEVFLNKITN
ncbi:TDP-N-acetylfucosamine:lipid II N-acetylfucosaminyltransferase [Mesohalobacter halotolerans]|uniref:4-alpha-L-fucosyltransferase glycosyl transferase group 56 n=1 Tax=Mesohalobacter halotolerans TaxID=1883405 RepID=A0A4U5TUL2_9FLAO|nr:TDP-N-acetylfucosamine:lipid II N-acetylfucosaminyltransferase [Mesohalobacter halotolerans]TKS56988.1 hypothetical protein FCN74_00770 [Mesohalobacter halotolerans]